MPTLSSAAPVLETEVFWDRHRKKVYAALVLALLTVAAWGGYRLYSERRDATAASSLTVAKTVADFQKIITQYPGTMAAASAHLFLAEEWRKDKKFNEANATLQSFVDKNPKHQLKGPARMAMAANLEALGKRDEALTIYQRLAADDPQGFIAPVALLSEVHILTEKNQVDEAKRVCESILTKYRDSLLANEATRQLRLLKGGSEEEKPSIQPVKTTFTTPAPAANVPALLLRPPDQPAKAPSAAAAPTAEGAAPTAAAVAPTAAPPVESIPKKTRHRKR